MARLPDLIEFAAEHKLRIGTIADLIHYRSANESLVRRTVEREIETASGRFKLIAFRDKPTGASHLVLVRGEISADAETLVRVHEPLSVIDLLETGTGVHTWGVSEALAAIAASGRGVMVLLNCSQSDDALEARLSDDSPDARASRRSDRSADLRTYGIGAQILRDLGVGRMRLLAAPRKMPSMTGFGLEVIGYADLPKRGA